MSGMISVTKLQQDQSQQKVSIEDQIFLSFLEYAGINIDELTKVD
jgi:hypothetical protein